MFGKQKLIDANQAVSIFQLIQVFGEALVSYGENPPSSQQIEEYLGSGTLKQKEFFRENLQNNIVLKRGGNEKGLVLLADYFRRNVLELRELGWSFSSADSYAEQFSIAKIKEEYDVGGGCRYYDGSLSKEKTIHVLGKFSSQEKLPNNYVVNMFEEYVETTEYDVSSIPSVRLEFYSDRDWNLYKKKINFFPKKKDSFSVEIYYIPLKLKLQSSDKDTLHREILFYLNSGYSLSDKRNFFNPMKHLLGYPGGPYPTNLAESTLARHFYYAASANFLSLNHLRQEKPKGVIDLQPNSFKP